METSFKLLLAALLIVILAACSGGSQERPSASEPTSHNVTYFIGGTAKTASVTYENASGGTSQEDVSLPWEKRIAVEPGGFMYVSAQSGDTGSRIINCKILVDGSLVETGESNGEFVIATCSGSAPD